MTGHYPDQPETVLMCWDCYHLHGPMASDGAACRMCGGTVRQYDLADE